MLALMLPQCQSFYAEQNVIFSKSDSPLVVISDSHSPLTTPS